MPCCMPESTLSVTEGELRSALRVWIRTMPKRFLRELERQRAIDASKRGDPDKRFDFEAAIAEHIADHFARARWSITKPEPQELGSPPAWSGHRDQDA